MLNGNHHNGVQGAPSFSARQALDGKRILFIGGTGFLGKVTLSMLLSSYDNLGRVYVLVRPGAGFTAERRFYEKVVTAPPFDPLRALYGHRLGDWLREKVVPVAGDVAREALGLDKDLLRSLEGNLDVIVNSSGHVSFNPPLEQALNVNVFGVMNVVDVALSVGASLVHVSTCFVRGMKGGRVMEDDPDEPVVGYFPRKGELGDRDFNLDDEVEDCRRLTKHVRERANDKALLSMFRAQARTRLDDEGRDPDSEKNLATGVQRERKLWVAAELSRVGIERAKHWGWPNIYTYTKSLGDQVVAKAGFPVSAGGRGLRYSVVRPAIVESALRYPFPGWNEGFTTTAPLAFLSLKGHRQYPAGEKLILDVVPVDLIAAGLIAATAATAVGEQEPIYQLGSGDSNPLYARRAVDLLALHKRKYFLARETGWKWLNEVLARLEPVATTEKRYNARSAPMLQKLARGVVSWLDERKPRWGAEGITGLLERAKSGVERLEEVTKTTDELFQLFMPFIFQNHYTFSCAAIRRLYARMDPEDRERIPWDPERLDWLDYWINVHMEGLKTWVFPSLEEEFEAQSRLTSQKRVYTHRDLLEMFESATRKHGSRVALRMLRTSLAPAPNGEAKETDGHAPAWTESPNEVPAENAAEMVDEWTYADLDELTLRAASNFVALGVNPGDRVMLLAENSPEWGMTYFGALKAGATCVPVDPQSTMDEVINLLRSSRARTLVWSAKVADRLGEANFAARAHNELGADHGVNTRFFDEVFAEPPAGIVVPTRSGRADEVASLIFTSGTTGRPKGVMLTHHNFSSLVSKVSRVFDMNHRDALLSVLPLHHTFEFTCGLLMPLSRGATITYLDEVNSDALSYAFENTRITSMIGVPALWQLLHRKIMSELSSRGPIVERGVKALWSLNRRVREKTPFNLGPVLFRPVHEKLGGRIRLMVSGGSALPPQVLETFYDLGFNLYEGYGLTEAAPVLTVNGPSVKGLLPGSVGEALPGIEVKIAEPDSQGVGEVVARGPNVMLGYFEDPGATAETVKDGWLHTGDLGRFDEEHRLYIVGRSKDVIVEASGKNIYPDELEEVYGDSPYVKELSIVGLPEDVAATSSGATAGTSAERVACLVVPDFERGDKDGLSRSETRARVEAHFRDVSSQLPVYKRVKVLHLRDGELQKTATRKVKRKPVVEELKRLTRAAQLGPLHAGAPQATQHDWLLEVIATVTGRSRSEVTLASRFTDDLGFDSLMYAELVSALEAAGAELGNLADEGTELTGLATVDDLARRLAAAQSGSRAKGRAAARGERAVAKQGGLIQWTGEGDDAEITVPEPVAELGRRGLALGRRLFYEQIFDVEVTGRAYIPPDRVFIVAANHSSHLDIGLVKHALGEYGADAATVAAKDYFFGDPVKRAFFESMTNLVPMDRQGSLRQSLKLASAVLERGQVLILFPEGTRSVDGQVDEFKASLGFLAIHNETDVLPIYLDGAFEAMPKGQLLPSKREMAARIGPVIGWQTLRERTRHLPRSEAYREASRLVRDAVLALRDRRRPELQTAPARSQPASAPAHEAPASEPPSKTPHA